MDNKIKELKSYVEHLEKMLSIYVDLCKRKDETINFYEKELNNKNDCFKSDIHDLEKTIKVYENLCKIKNETINYYKTELSYK